MSIPTHTSPRAATASLVLIGAALLAGVLVVALLVGPDSVPVLAGCMFVLAGLFVLGAWGFKRQLTARRRFEDHQERPSWLWRTVTRRQLVATLGALAVVTTGTGTWAAIDWVNAGSATASAQPVTSTTAPVMPVQPAVPSPSPTDTSQVAGGMASTSDSASPAPAPGSTTFLDEVTPVDGSDNSGPVRFASQQYPRSVSMSCYAAKDDYLQWDVAGSSTFSTTVGIADDAQDAFGAVAQFAFYDQDNRALLPHPVDVSVGHPAPIHLNLANVVNLRVTCAGRDSTTSDQRGVTASLGDPVTVAS